MSSADSLQSAQRAPKAPRPFDEDDEYGDAEKNFQPRSPRFWMIIIGMYASIFLVALVSFAEYEFCSAGLTFSAPTGSNDHRSRHPWHHQRIRLDRGYWLVWQRLHVDCRYFQPSVRPHL